MRRRVILMFVVCYAAMGCRSATKPVAEPVADARDAEVEYEAVTASALVFDPPVIAGEAPLELGRAHREPGAFVGYEGPTVEHFYIRMDDSQVHNGIGGRGGGGRFGRGGGGNFDHYERRAITERIGVRFR